MKRSMFSAVFCNEAAAILAGLDKDAIERMALKLAAIREQGGRLFLLGVGGSAASASHATNDFRKLCGFEAYCPSDNVSELTARANDDGFETVFEEYLKTSHLSPRDAVMIFSVGGGNEKKNISVNLVRAIRYAREAGAVVIGIVGRDGGFTAEQADECVVVPVVNPEYVTPHTEAFHGVIWHLLVSHPALNKVVAKWETVR